MASKVKMTALRKLGEDEKLAPQAKTILNTLIGAVGLNETIDRDDLVKKLGEDDSLKTRQDPGRVVAYYIPKMVEAGLISVEKEAVEAAEGEEKPKRGRKAKADVGPEEVNVDEATA